MGYYNRWNNSYVWLIKIISGDNKEWNGFFGRNYSDTASWSVQHTTDVGYIITG